MHKNPSAASRRRHAIESAMRSLKLAGDAKLDIRVDTDESAVTFLIHNAAPAN